MIEKVDPWDNNSNKMIMRERLLSEMATFAVDSKWEEVLT
jgi:hypothetical protein